MKVDSHIAIARARVRGKELTRHYGVRLDLGRCFALSGGLGVPRLWEYSTRAVLEGFGQSLEQTKSLAPPERLGHAFHEARENLVRRSEILVERKFPDATLIGVSVDSGELAVVAAGPARAYLHRNGAPRRLTKRDDEPNGILYAQPFRCGENLEPGDIVLAGSVSAFSVKAVGKLAAVLEKDPSAPTSVLASILSEPATRAGVGAVALALRVL